MIANVLFYNLLIFNLTILLFVILFYCSECIVILQELFQLATISVIGNYPIVFS